MSHRKENLRKLRELVTQKREVVHFLMAKGVARSIAEAIQRACLGEIKGLHDEVAKRLTCSGGIAFDTAPKRVVLVGPRGVGKTTSLLKLARLYREHFSVGLVSLDHEKQGAYEQIASFAEQWELPFTSDLAMMDETLDLILIDTTGCNFYQTNQVDAVGEMLTSLGEAEVHLVLSTGAQEVDLVGAIHQFSALPLSGLIFTKLDETLGAGVLINIASRVPYPLSYVAFGYPLPGEIQVADPQLLTRKILTDFNDAQFQALRDYSLTK